jgi:hypothetical protein
MNKIHVARDDVYYACRRTVCHSVFPDSFRERARGHTSVKLVVADNLDTYKPCPFAEAQD